MTRHSSPALGLPLIEVPTGVYADDAAALAAMTEERDKLRIECDRVTTYLHGRIEGLTEERDRLRHVLGRLQRGLVHVETGRIPSPGLTLCGLSDKNHVTRRFPLTSEAEVTCPDCQQRMRECGR